MRSFAIAKRVLTELVRDKRTLALMFLAPIIIMWLLNVMFSANTSTNASLATVNVSPAITRNLNAVKGVSTHSYQTNHRAQVALNDHQVDSVIHYHHGKYDVTYANTDSSKTALTKQALKAAMTKDQFTTMSSRIKQLQAMVVATNPQAAQQLAAHQHSQQAKIKNHYNYGDHNTGFFAKITPILMGFFIFLFVFLISGMGLLHERVNGTLSRLLATPVKRSEIVFGYMLSYGLIAILQSIVIVITTIWLLKIEVVGSIFDIVVISLLFALVALAFGLLLSTLADSELQMMQFIPIVVVPQVFFSGIIPLDTMAKWVQYIGKILPLTYSGDALTKIVMEGTPLTKLGGDIFALFVFLIVLMTLNIIGLKRYRKV